MPCDGQAGDAGKLYLQHVNRVINWRILDRSDCSYLSCTACNGRLQFCAGSPRIEGVFYRIGGALGKLVFSQVQEIFIQGGKPAQNCLIWRTGNCRVSQVSNPCIRPVLVIFLVG